MTMPVLSRPTRDQAFSYIVPDVEDALPENVLRRILPDATPPSEIDKVVEGFHTFLISLANGTIIIKKDETD